MNHQFNAASEPSSFGRIRFYLIENPSSWMGCFSVPSLNLSCSREQGIDSLRQLCNLLNKQLPHLYHYYEVFDV
ncbi:MAG: hypothetical protein RID09_20345 [Coleofasciculus sp. G1-WW12-02]|uniref:hypothetical protein n=1 Tax=Coleofasciculus sp. G1-WW12-02 TaxID=3068483 RepID=UPI0032F869BC